MSTTIILSNLAVGPLLLVLALIFKANPPKKINWAYGYRTARSRKSQEAWDAANSYANELMLWIAIITSVCQIGFYFLLPPAIALLVACGVMTLLLIGMMVIVEIYLKDNFDDEGRKKE